MAHLNAEVIQLFLFTDDEFSDNPSSLEFHLNVFTSSVDLKVLCRKQKFIVYISLLMTSGLNDLWFTVNISIKVSRVILIKETCHMFHMKTNLYNNSG